MLPWPLREKIIGENPETTSAFLVCCLMEAEMGFEENLADSKQRLASMVDIFFFFVLVGMELNVALSGEPGGWRLVPGFM